MERVVAFVNILNLKWFHPAQGRKAVLEETSVLGHRTVSAGILPASTWLQAIEPNFQIGSGRCPIEPACSSAIQLMPARHED